MTSRDDIAARVTALADRSIACTAFAGAPRATSSRRSRLPTSSAKSPSMSGGDGMKSDRRGNQNASCNGRHTMTDDRSSGSSRNNARKTGPGNPPVECRFKPGNPGRPRGSRNKLGEDFINALADDFAKHGAVAIERVREEKPDAYLKVIATLMPKDLNLNVRQLDDLSDEQLMRKLQQVTELARPLLAKLPTMIDVTPVGVDVGVDSEPAADTPDKSST